MTPQHNPIRDEIVAALAAELPLEAPAVAGILTVPPKADMGDYAFPCFALAKELRRAPHEIAAELAGALAGATSYTATAAGPYVNFDVDRASATAHVLGIVLSAADAYGRSDAGAGKTIVVDYSSPNIAKHLGVHHLRSAIIGRALCRLLEETGYDCVGVNHLGDWGTSFGKLIVAFERYDDLDAETATVTDLQDAYVRYSRESKATDDEDLDDTARDAFRRLEEGDPEAVALWERFKEISWTEFARIYDMLGIEFDHVTGESFYVEMADECIERMTAAGIAEESDGALIVRLDDLDMPPCMLRKRDGTTIYATRDICAAEYRKKTFDFERAIYVVGGEQKLHFAQIRAVLDRMGHDWSEAIEHVDFGLIKFLDAATGQARKGSTREGKMILLEEVLREGMDRARAKIAENEDRMPEGVDLDELAAQVGIGAVVFSDLAVRRNKDVVFDWDRMLDFEGDTGPYVQYAHARLCSILRKAGAEDAPPAEADYALLALPEEWALVRALEDWPSRVLTAADTREPCVIANYLLELCAQFSTYYSAGMREPERRVLCDDAAVRAARMALVHAVRHVIRNGLALLGVAAPARM